MFLKFLENLKQMFAYERKKILSGGKGPINILQPIYFNKNICVVLNNGFLEMALTYDIIQAGTVLLKTDMLSLLSISVDYMDADGD